MNPRLLLVIFLLMKKQIIRKTGRSSRISGSFNRSSLICLLSKFIVESIFDCKTELCLVVPGRQKNVFLHKKVSIYNINSMILMNRTHHFLTVNTST